MGLVIKRPIPQVTVTGEIFGSGPIVPTWSPGLQTYEISGVEILSSTVSVPYVGVALAAQPGSGAIFLNPDNTLNSVYNAAAQFENPVTKQYEGYIEFASEVGPTFTYAVYNPHEYEVQFVGQNYSDSSVTFSLVQGVPVPGPTVGTGLPELIMGGAGLLGWWRRKRTGAARAA